jgi:aryl-alcohol dehydrogenase-like predicted oxidoreductase
METLLGEWIANRNIRPQAVIIVKGAHTPFCDPSNLRSQFASSLERLRTDYADVYLMHRDNLEIPVGEFVDALDELVTSGQVRLAGVSNWTLRRILEANAYAAANGRRPIGAVSNNFSLAHMVHPVWSGCEAASDSAWREWLAESQTPLLSWSSQARGYFA